MLAGMSLMDLRHVLRPWRRQPALAACVIGVLALIAITLVGLSTTLGLVIALLGVQLVTGNQHPWLPAGAGRTRSSITRISLRF